MQRTKSVGRRIPGFGLDERLRAKRSQIRINTAVGRAYGVIEAHEALINLPSTRFSLTHDESTSLGVGIVYGRSVGSTRTREVYITQIVGTPMW
jgi:hypothetical protein